MASDASLDAAPDAARSADRGPLFLFIALSLGLLGVEATLLEHLAAMGPQAHLMAQAITVDVVLGFPLLYYALVVRKQGVAAATVLPVFLVSVYLAKQMIPTTHASLLGYALWLVAPLELAVVALSVRKVRALRARARALGSSDESLDPLALNLGAARALFDAPRFAKMLGYELTMMTYAFRKVPVLRTPGSASFTYHEECGYAGLMWGLGIVALGELFGVHLLLHLHWSPTAAWVASALSLYGIIFLRGDWKAIQARPVEISEEGFALRHGLRWQLDVPRAEVAEVRRLGATEALKPDVRDRLDLVLAGEAQLLITLHNPLTAQGLYGFTREVRQIALAVDDPSGVLRAWHEHDPAQDDACSVG